MSASSLWIHVNPFMRRDLGVVAGLALIRAFDSYALMNRNSRERMHILSSTADRKSANHFATPGRVDGNGVAKIIVARNISFGRHKSSIRGRGILP